MAFHATDRTGGHRPGRDHLDGPPPPPRRTGSFMVAVLLVTAGAIGAIWFATRGDTRVDAVTLSAPVHRGDTITLADLSVVRVAVDGNRARLASPSVARTAIVGRQAMVDLAAGTLITPEMVGSDTPPAGDATVGVSLTPDELPSARPRAGDWVQVVTADKSTGQPTPIGLPVQVSAIGPATGGASGGDLVVYLTAPSATAQAIAGAASTDTGVHLLGVRP